VNARSGERWLQQVLDAMPEQIAVLDRNGIILMVNEAWQRFGRENSSSTHGTPFGGLRHSRGTSFGQHLRLLNQLGHGLAPCPGQARRTCSRAVARALGRQDL
jgi:PAS domain-containing protein